MQISITRRDGTQHVIQYDDEDHALLSRYRWRVRPTHTPGLFYAITHTTTDGRRTTVHMHTLLSGRGCDHINHDGLDNRRSNLRSATLSQQGGNRQPGTHSSKFKGVHWYKKSGRWRAKIQSRHLGTFDSELDAARAYDAAALHLWGAYALLNIPEAQGGPS